MKLEHGKHDGPVLPVAYVPRVSGRLRDRLLQLLHTDTSKTESEIGKKCRNDAKPNVKGGPHELARIVSKIIDETRVQRSCSANDT